MDEESRRRGELVVANNPAGVGLPTKLTPECLVNYLELVAETGQITRSAIMCGVSPRAVHARRASDPEYEALVKEARAAYTDTLRQEVHRRGVEGWKERGLFDKEGNEIGEVWRFSDRLLELEIKRSDPSYRESVSVAVEGNLGTHTTPSVNEAALKKLSKEGRAALRVVMSELAPEVLPTDGGEEIVVPPAEESKT